MNGKSFIVSRSSFGFEGLNVYQESLVFVDFIYTLTTTWPKTETFGLMDQIKRASVSITLNIAEGSSRTKKDFKHFLTLSRGSCYECYAILQIAYKRNYITGENLAIASEYCNKIARMLSALKSSIN